MVHLPHATGKRVPSDFDGLAFLQAANLRLIDKRTHPNPVQISDLHQQIAGRDKRVLAHRQVVRHAGMRRRDIQIAQEVGGGRQSGAGFCQLSFRVTDLWLGEAVVELLFQRVQVGLGHVQLCLRGIDFSLRRGAALQQPLHRLQVLLRGIAVRLCLHQRIAGGKHFLLRSAGGHGLQFGFRALHLRLGARDLGPCVGVIQLQQQLACLHPVSLKDFDPLDRGGHGSMGFEVVDGLDLAVGGDAGGDGFASRRGRCGPGPECGGMTATTRKDHHCQNDTDEDDPARFPGQTGSAALN